MFGSDASWDTQWKQLIAGYAIEPMAHAVAETVPNETIGNCPSASASASITIKHRIRQVGEAPPGAALAVQLGLDYRLESSPYQALGSSTTNASFSIKYGQTVDGVYSDNGRCQPGRSCSGRMYVEGSTSDIVEITAQAGANAYCVITPDGPRGVTAQAVADPFLFIDPNWEWASAFVVEQESVKNPGEWVEVTRLWQTDSFPVADAGEDQSATFIGSIIQLDGSQSFDPDGDPITYHWEFVSTPPGSGATLSDPANSKPTFTVDKYGTYDVQLVVSDPWATSSPDIVTVSFGNLKPVANAGTSQSVLVGETVLLDGSGSSDPNGDGLTYSWTLGSFPTGSLSAIADPTASMTSFIPDMPGSYVAELIVSDGLLESDPSTVQIQAAIAGTDAIEAVRNVAGVISGIDEERFKNRNMKNTLINKLNTVIANIQAGNYSDAVGQLQNDILGKIDGCTTSGEPDRNDWISDCVSQEQVYPRIMEAIDLLRDFV